MKKQKLTAADLALYLFAEIKVQFTRHGETYTGELVSCGLDSMQLQNVKGPNASRQDYRIFNTEDFMPILRPLSDLTEEEALHLHVIVYGRDYSGIINILDWWDLAIPLRGPEINFVLGHAHAWRYLLSIGIDLFGWIEAGLAIDKTKIQTVQP